MLHHREFRAMLSGHAVLFGWIGCNILVFLLELFLPQDALRSFNCIPEVVVGGWGHLMAGNPQFADWQGFASLVTYAFLHADLEHLLFNMIYLWIFGYLISELLGQRWTFLIYLLTALGGSVCYVIFNSDSAIPMLGASGAVSGFQGAYLGLAVRFSLPHAFVWPLASPVSPTALGILVGIWFYLDLSGSLGSDSGGIAFATHLGGFVTGLFLTSFVTPRPKGV